MIAMSDSMIFFIEALLCDGERQMTWHSLRPSNI
jgi:hypothetical protein